MVKKVSTDGFVPRRATRYMGEHHLPKPIESHEPNGLVKDTATEEATVLKPTGKGLSRAEIDESLSSIALDEEQQVKQRRAPGRRRRIIKRVIIVLVLAAVVVGGWIGVRALMAGMTVFKGDILGLVQNKPLKADEKGRSNILILGTSEDDPGHGGAYLTDSMMIMSLDQSKKNVYMFSIPRDLYVKYGMACNSGYQGKINEYFNCVNDDWTKPEAEDERLTGTRKFVGEIFGLDIPYAVHVNNTVIKEAVNAVGGITVNIESRDPRGILDSNFDWKCGVGDYKVSRAEQIRRCPPNGHFIQFPNGNVQLDGEHALYLAMARGDLAPTYGLEQSNFDREKNQQKVIIALKEKAVSTGTLTDLGKVMGLIDAFGENLRTNFDTSEIRTLINLGAEIKSSNIKTISLLDDEEPVVTTGNYGGASVVIPGAGVFDYDAIRSYIKKNIYATEVTREAAKVVVLNGSGVAGVAQIQADVLAELGMSPQDIANAPTSDYTSTVVYQLNSKKPASAAKLAELYRTKLLTSTPPIEVTGETDFVVIVGSSRPSTSE